jgi:ABC-type branched-subunit amino acid transport system ATPase component
MMKRRETEYWSTILRNFTDFEGKENFMSAHHFAIVVTIDMYSIVVIAGDGIGAEGIPESIKVLDAVCAAHPRHGRQRDDG